MNEDLIIEILTAVEDGQIEEVDRLLTTHPDFVNYDEGIGGWLDSAIYSEDYEMIERLIKLGCDVNAENELGSPLSSAITQDSPELVALLLKSGSVPQSRHRNVLGAIVGDSENALSILKLLKEYGADLNEIFLDENTGQRINALSYAIKYKKTDVVNYLTELGCQLPGDV